LNKNLLIVFSSNPLVFVLFYKAPLKHHFYFWASCTGNQNHLTVLFSYTYCSMVVIIGVFWCAFY